MQEIKQILNTVAITQSLLVIKGFVACQEGKIQLQKPKKRTAFMAQREDEE